MELKYQNAGTAFSVGGCCAIASIQWFNSDNHNFWSNQEWVAKQEQEILGYEEEIRAKGKSLAFASVNSQQTKAAEMLERLGYVCPFDGWAKRDPSVINTGSVVRVYVKPVYGTVSL